MHENKNKSKPSTHKSSLPTLLDPEMIRKMVGKERGYQDDILTLSCI